MNRTTSIAQDPPHLAATLESVAEARRYHAWLAREIRPHLRYPTLEIGAGIGTLAAALTNLGMHMLVSEPHPDFAKELEVACSQDEKLTAVEPLALPITSWSESAGHPTTVLLSNVLEHIDEDVEAIASILHRAPSVDRLVVVVPAHMWAFAPLDRVLGHYRRYTKTTLGQAMSQAGWDVEVLRYFNPLGAIAWAASGRIFGRSSIAPWQTRIVEACMPLLSTVDAIFRGHLIGQSLVAVGRRPRN